MNDKSFNKHYIKYRKKKIVDCPVCRESRMVIVSTNNRNRSQILCKKCFRRTKLGHNV